MAQKIARLWPPDGTDGWGGFTDGLGITDGPGEVEREDFVIAFAELEEAKRQRQEHLKRLQERAALENGPAERDLSNKEEHLKRLQERAALENGRNQTLYENALGLPLHYGSTLALRHVRSGKFVNVQTKQYSSGASSGRLVNLDGSVFGKPSGQFVVGAILKYFTHGEVVTDGSPVLLQSAELAEYFLEPSGSLASPGLNPRYFDGLWRHRG
ncbi:hypothetical protein T484DRAFT_1765596 [Baffinella frigidus]|nr:hypothetical protein T484DRAFT_1765596 [Cryptophyta sp. CCMP2293]